MHDECTPIKIFVTTNYDQFIFLEENREVTGNTVLNSINKKNLLIDNPILVSPNMEVLDGQNRLEAAKMKGFPIYYRIAQATTREDISLLQNQKPWAIKDHAYFYKHKQDYQFIIDLVENYDHSWHFVIVCCDSHKDAFTRFRNGEMEIKEDKQELTDRFQKLKELTDAIKFLTTTCGKKFSAITHKFKRSLWSFMKRKDYDHKRLLHAINMYPNHVIDLLTINSETLILQGIERRLYNYHRKNKDIATLD